MWIMVNNYILYPTVEQFNSTRIVCNFLYQKDYTVIDWD